jgi:uncharacterized membrane protein HdeD (DUF308 family)
MASHTTMMNVERSTLVLRGVIAILFGVAAVFWPGLTAEVLLYLFAAFLAIDGFTALLVGLVYLNQLNKAALLMLVGLLQLAIGLFLFRNPDITFATLILIFGFSLIAIGLFSFAHAFTNTREASNTRTMHAILGVLGLVIGVVILLQPVAGGLAFVWVLGLYALIAGPVMIAMSTDMGKMAKK